MSAPYYGHVVGRFLLMEADGSDAGRNPDVFAATDLEVIITPADTIRRGPDEPATIVPFPTVCTVGPDGWIRDPLGQPGVWLHEGTYNVTFDQPYPKPFTIEVADTHTLAAPLDLSVAGAAT